MRCCNALHACVYHPARAPLARRLCCGASCFSWVGKAICICWLPLLAASAGCLCSLLAASARCLCCCSRQATLVLHPTSSPQDESYIYQVAAQLKAISDKKLASLAAKEKTNSPPEITYEMKRHLNESCGQLTSKDLYGMMTLLEELCKKSVNEVTAQLGSDPAERAHSPYAPFSRLLAPCLLHAPLF